MSPACERAGCDGELHYTGERDPITNEDIEAGPCPRWQPAPPKPQVMPGGVDFFGVSA